MNVINSIVLKCGDGVLWLGHVLKSFFVGLWGVIDAILNPVLSPLLSVLNPICTSIGNAVYAVLSPLPVWVGLTILSAIAGVVMLIAFRYTSNQKAIGRARDQITANLLTLKLFKDDIGIGFRAQGKLLKALGKLQLLMLLPILIMILPLMLGVAQMGVRHQWRPLQPGEETMITLHLKEGQKDIRDISLAPSAGLAETVGPVNADGTVLWRCHAAKPGEYTLQFNVGGTQVEKLLIVGAPFEPVSAERPGRSWTAQILHPIEKPFPADSPVQLITIDYPGVQSYIYGESWWILYFFVISMVFALIFKPVFKVRF